MLRTDLKSVRFDPECGHVTHDEVGGGRRGPATESVPRLRTECEYSFKKHIQIIHTNADTLGYTQLCVSFCAFLMFSFIYK